MSRNPNWTPTPGFEPEKPPAQANPIVAAFAKATMAAELGGFTLGLGWAGGEFVNRVMQGGTGEQMVGNLVGGAVGLAVGSALTYAAVKIAEGGRTAAE